MATYEQWDNSGVLWRNERREKETHPNATGTAMIDGIEYYVSAWTKEGKKGKFQSLSFKRKDSERPTTKQGQPRRDEDEDLVPF